MIELRYGNTHTFFLPGPEGGLLVDTDYAGTLPAFYKEIKRKGIRVADIGYVLATHYHPDHMGLIGDLMQQGVKLLLPDVQEEAVRFSEPIFERDRVPFTPIDTEKALRFSCRESRAFLARIGIAGEILHTPSHSGDSISLVLDDGDCFVGDLEPSAYIEAYEDPGALKRDWERILAFRSGRIFYAHRPPEMRKEPL